VSRRDPDSARRELIAFGRAAVEARLVESTSGNVSLRLGATRMLVSGAGSELGGLTPEAIAVVGLEDGRRLEGAEPSLERELHRRVFLARPSAGAVLHCQSRAATLLACRETAPADLNFIPEIPAYVRAHAWVPYRPPGSEALAEAVARAFDDPDVTVVQLRSHGQVVAGSTPAAVLRRARFFELACWMAVREPRLRTLPAEQVAALREYARDD
jgi:ribulose-5-phosphate 4-epimerase/fuculose-1-phosphate aldolase